jgi:hypothetical protein
VPRGISSGSEKRGTEFYPWVPEDDEHSVFFNNNNKDTVLQTADLQEESHLVMV